MNESIIILEAMRYILISAFFGLCAGILVQESRSQGMAQVDVSIKYLKSTDSLFIEVPSYSGRYRIEARDLDVPDSPWVTLVADTSLNQRDANFTKVSPLFPVSGNMIFRVYHDDPGIPVFTRTGQSPRIAIVFAADQKPGSLYFNQQMDLGISDPVEHQNPDNIVTDSEPAVTLVPQVALCRDGHMIDWLREVPAGSWRNGNTESGDRFIPDAILECSEEHGGYIPEPGFIIPLSD